MPLATLLAHLNRLIYAISRSYCTARSAKTAILLQPLPLLIFVYCTNFSNVIYRESTLTSMIITKTIVILFDSW